LRALCLAHIELHDNLFPNLSEKLPSEIQRDLEFIERKKAEEDIPKDDVILTYVKGTSMGNVVIQGLTSLLFPCLVTSTVDYTPVFVASLSLSIRICECCTYAFGGSRPPVVRTRPGK